MAIEAIIQKTPRGLSATTSADAEALDGLAMGVDYRAVFTRVMGRSLQHHKLLFALIKIARENYDGDITKDSVIDVLKLRTGHVRLTQLATGEVVMAPASISFAAMDQDAFNAWFPKAVDVLCRDFCPGLERHLAMREIERQAGTRFEPVKQREDA